MLNHDRQMAVATETAKGTSGPSCSKLMTSSINASSEVHGYTIPLPTYMYLCVIIVLATTGYWGCLTINLKNSTI